MQQSGTYHFANLSLSSSNIVDVTQHEKNILDRIVDLYTMLYLQKYSKINPQFTSVYVLNSVFNKTLTIKLLVNGPQKKDNDSISIIPKDTTKIHGVIGVWKRGGILTTPLLGYDMELPQKAGIYRLLSLEIMKTGRESNLLVNASGGVGDFKRKRGAQTFVEFNGVYYGKNMSILRKAPWMILTLLTKFGVWYIKRRKDI